MSKVAVIGGGAGGEITPLKTFFSVLFIISLSLRVFFYYIIISKKIGSVNNIRR